jgi:GNAT superfamily N-acetyltransferase
MPLPPGYTLRHPTEPDLVAVHDLMRAVDLAESGEADDDLDGLRHAWQDLDLDADAWVITAPGGAIVAYATLEHHGHTALDADVYTHPDHLGRGLGTAINRALEARAAAHIPLAPSGTPVVLTTYINGTSQVAPPLLTSEGYRLVRHFWRMIIDLDAPPPAPVWPARIIPHPFVAGDDDARAHAAFTEAFADMWGFTPATLAEWRDEMMARPDFDPALWTLALDGDDIAGICISFPTTDRGWIRSLGVRRPWRRRGLAFALLNHTFGLYWARGERQIGLGVDAASPTGATHLYERAGMHVTRTFQRWEKILRDA